MNDMKATRSMFGRVERYPTLDYVESMKTNRKKLEYWLRNLRDPSNGQETEILRRIQNLLADKNTIWDESDQGIENSFSTKG